jgi:predicted ATPase
MNNITLDGYNVVTGGPSAGKSSVLRELAVRGYRTMPEAAQLVTDREISKGNDIDALYGTEALEQKIESVDVEIAKQARKADEPVFFDRTFIDALAYRRGFGLKDNTTFVKNELRKFDVESFDNVFVMDLLDIEDDYHRYEENQNEAQRIHDTIIETYKEFVPEETIHVIEPSTVEHRADIIEGKIMNYG